MNTTHKTITLWQLIAYQLLFHIGIAAICMFAANFILNHYWLPFYFQMENNFPHPRELILEPDLEHYQDISLEQLQELSASLQVLDENLTVIGDSIAKTPHDRSHVDPTQLTLQETQALLLSYNTMLDKLEQMKAENDKLEAQSHRLIANLSHDLKSPMTNLKGYAELLEQEQLSAEEEKLYISRIHSNISTLNSMVELLSEQVKFQYNDYPLKLERRDMNDFLREVCANYYTIFEKQGFQMEIQIAEEAFYLNFDALNMRRVYANLLENILSHNTAPTQVQICTQLLPICYQVQIKDNGAGIAAEDQDKIFEPFYQGDVSRTKQHSGLGLFVVKQILEKHGAAIFLEREPAYRTVFTIRFPLS